MKAWTALVLSWLIPGSGFIMYGRWGRGLAHFVTIGATFGLGLALHSSVDWPIWSIRSPGFNLINNFTFITQMGGGLPAVASFVVANGAGASANPLLEWLAGEPKHYSYELGSYFLIIAGALNYFAMGNFYDRFLHPRTAAPLSAESRTSEKA